MKISKDANAKVFYFQLTKTDWENDWKSFINSVKKLSGWKYDGEKIWTLPIEHYQEVIRLKNKYLMTEDLTKDLFGII